MPREQSSAEMATVASEIMNIARQGGPIRLYKNRLIDAMNGTGGGTPSVLDCVERVLRPYIDKCESLAASVLTQREPK
jgi:hypothetical protein